MTQGYSNFGKIRTAPNFQKQIEIDHYSYAFNPYATISKEEISPFLFGRIVSGGTV